MKHSRIFLGATTALLAIAGIAAAKAHRQPSTRLWYYTGALPNQHLCLQANFATHCGIVPGGTIKCFYATSAGATAAQLTLYTKQVNTSTCGQIAIYKND
jgi:hypothetical protein